MMLATAGSRGIVLLGCGRMGGALLEGWLSRGLALEAIHVIEPAPSERLRGLARRGLHLGDALPKAPSALVLAVKPQVMAEALAGVALPCAPDTLVLTVAAGTPIAAYERVFGPRAAIVRAMPNTPAAVGRGITALVGNMAAGPEAMALAEALMLAVGDVVTLQDEAQMDAVTALSGSGPAYVFHLIEALAEAGIAEGLAPDLSMRLARATVGGAGELARQAPEPASELRRNVTSPGGTTAAALEVLMDPQTGLGVLMRRAVAAAAARSRELGRAG
jgi:pyrroline-5-carboxylate reductase